MTEDETKEYDVLIPQETYALLEFEQEDSLGSAVINIGLRGFEPKVVFGWHLSLAMELHEVDSDKLPTDAERDVVDEFGKVLDVGVIGEEQDKPNAVFLGQIFWNGTLELIWRVFDPDRANEFLQKLVKEEGERRPRAFDFRMEHDPNWDLCQWHLEEHQGTE